MTDKKKYTTASHDAESTSTLNGVLKEFGYDAHQTIKVLRESPEAIAAIQEFLHDLPIVLKRALRRLKKKALLQLPPRRRPKDILQRVSLRTVLKRLRNGISVTITKQDYERIKPALGASGVDYVLDVCLLGDAIASLKELEGGMAPDWHITIHPRTEVV